VHTTLATVPETLYFFFLFHLLPSRYVYPFLQPTETPSSTKPQCSSLYSSIFLFTSPFTSLY